MQRERLGERSWLYYDDRGAMRSDLLGNGVVQQTCRGTFGRELAEVVIADGERCLSESGRCVFLVDGTEATRFTTEFRRSLTTWLAAHPTESHNLVHSKTLEVVMNLANLVLRSSPVRVYSSVEHWEAAGQREVATFRRMPPIPPDWIAQETDEGEAFELEVLALIHEVNTTEGATRERALCSLLDRLRPWSCGFARRHFAGSALDLEDLAQDALQHLLVAIAQGKFELSQATSETSALAWCGAVLGNFIRSELRRRQRGLLVPEFDSRLPLQETIEERNLLEVFVRMLDLKIRDTARPEDAPRHLAQLETFLATVAAAPGGASPDRRTSNRLSQQRSRARRFARDVWHRVKRDEAVPDELSELARALRLE